MEPGWHHVAVCNKGELVRLYLDGQQVAVNFQSFSTPEGTLFYCGRSPAPGSDGTSQRLQGQVDEVAVYNRALSGTEIQAIYEANSAAAR